MGDLEVGIKEKLRNRESAFQLRGNAKLTRKFERILVEPERFRLIAQRNDLRQIQERIRVEFNIGGEVDQIVWRRTLSGVPQLGDSGGLERLADARTSRLSALFVRRRLVKFDPFVLFRRFLRSGRGGVARSRLLRI